MEKNESKMSKCFDGLKGEFNKIVWADRQDVSKQTTAVVITSVVVALIIIVIDAVVNKGVSILINL